MAPKRPPLREQRERKLRRLSDPEVRRWYDNVARGSLITADAYLRSLFMFADRMGTDVHAITKLGEKELHSLLLDFVTREEKRGSAGHSILNYTKAVQSWLSHHGVKQTRAVKVRRAYDTPTIADERTPTQPELRRIFLACMLKDRVSAAMMAHSGVRPEVIGNYLGNDGLRLRDFPELVLRGKEVEFARTPAMVIVRPELSKAGHRYFTFLSEEGCGYVKGYLDTRLQEGETLGPDSDLIHPKWREKRFLRSINVSDGIRAGIRASLGREIKMRPYALRAYFDTQLLLAESKGKVAHDYRVFWMGHKGSMEARYTTNKGRLPSHILEDMRDAYQRCEAFLSTTPTSPEDGIVVEMRRTMLLGLGYSEEELKSVDVVGMDIAQFQTLIDRKRAAPPPSGKKQKLIDTGELGKYLEEGWTVVMPVNGQVVINPPSG